MNFKQLVFEEHNRINPKETYFTCDTLIGKYLIFEGADGSGWFGNFQQFGTHRVCEKLSSKKAAIEACQTHFENLIKSCLI